MNDTKTDREFDCPECGDGRVKLKSGWESITPRTIMRKGVRMELPRNLLIPTCDNCGSQWIDTTTGNEIDAYFKSLK